jgi:protein-L-isoaspartate(D-aspartate) O-methyltransferase
VIFSDEVASAFLAVPREKFIPGVLAEEGLATVYRDDAFVTKRDPRGMPLSSSSQPALMARMLELLDVRPGHRVLEIGAGTGYNAALLSHLVGPRGRVTSMDIDPQLVHEARRALRGSGSRVSLIAGDGRDGHDPGAPYDRIIVTACADDIPCTWLEQLTEGGLLELPLRLDPDGSAIQVIPVFRRIGHRLRSTAFTWGGFIPLHGGDGGWSAPPATLGASLSGDGKHTPLGSISGKAVSRMSPSAAKSLLASVLTANRRPLAGGRIEMNSMQPPLLLIYLLSRIPNSRRIAVYGDGRLGVGILDRRTGSLGVVSIRSPWMNNHTSSRRQTQWRLDGYGGDAAAADLKRLLYVWEDLQRAGRTQLLITAVGRGPTLRLRLNWTDA